MKVIVVFIRHGFSCANAIEKSGNILEQYKRLFYVDPPLTNYALNKISPMKKKYNSVKFDYILSSTMIRAEETALSLFPNKQILVVPYIKEINFGFDNVITDNPTEQLDKINKKLNKENLNYYYSTTKNDEWLKTSHLSDYDKFKDIILTDIVRKTTFRNGKRTITIAVITHSNFMKDIFKTQNKPNNVGSGIKVYNYENNYITEINQIPEKNSMFDKYDGTVIPDKVRSFDIITC